MKSKPPFSIGVIGAGMYGKTFLRALQSDSRAHLTWVCSATPTTTNAAADEHGIAGRTCDYREVLNDPQVQAIVIATPPHLHAELFIAAMKAGKHVFIEKPLATTPTDLALIVEAARNHPHLIAVEASLRHTRLQGKFEAVREMIRKGVLGDIYHIHHQALSQGTFIEYNKNGAWAMNKSLAGGGPILDWGVYDLSFHLGLLADLPQLVSLRSFTKSGLRDLSHLAPVCDVEQHGATWMEFDSGLTYYYERGAGVHGGTSCDTRIHGTRGGLRFSYLTWDSFKIEYFHDTNGPRKEFIETVNSQGCDDHVAAAKHFLDCLEGKVTPLMSVDLAAKHLAILFKILSA